MLAVPQSVLLHSFAGFPHKKASELNEIFYKACDEFTYRDYIDAMPYASDSSGKGDREITVYMGRQFGDVLYIHDYDERTNKLLKTASDQAMEAVRWLFKLDYRQAMKYLSLNESGYFNDHKDDTIEEHWARRVGLDLEFMISELKETIKKEGN